MCVRARGSPPQKEPPLVLLILLDRANLKKLLFVGEIVMLSGV